MHEPGLTDPRTVFELTRPGRLIDALEACMARRVAPLRSGWSATGHLGRDLERHYGVRVPRPAIDRALRVLARRGRIDLRAGRDGALWFRLRDQG
ncbi:hypothetical protein [Miltoncostaea marina]|uniref:hypothetical protein n=1 Tax=Miltoncostaea marina TaxID=2843215 RepID=UPI001C3DB967|nr:hypothetical protein [Miltoncostaea marina]